MRWEGENGETAMLLVLKKVRTELREERIGCSNSSPLRTVNLLRLDSLHCPSLRQPRLHTDPRVLSSASDKTVHDSKRRCREQNKKLIDSKTPFVLFRPLTYVNRTRTCFRLNRQDACLTPSRTPLWNTQTHHAIMRSSP